jgi:NAD+ synthase
MIKDLEATAKFISDWIAEQAEIAHAKTLVVGVSGGVDSALVVALCKRTSLPTYGVMMPCHSSSHSLDRGKELLAKFDVPHTTVDLSEAHSIIEKQVRQSIPFPHLTKVFSNEAQGALRSCLRAPTLDFVAKVWDGIIVGTGNRDEDEVTRYFQKRGDGCVDISPIAHLHKSEVYQLSEYLGVPQSIIDATPTADLWGPDAGQTDEGQLGLTYQEVEWGIRQAEKVQGQTRKVDFLMASQKDDLTSRQKQVLMTLGEMEFTSRHKENPNLPVCPIRSTKFRSTKFVE